ncbi:prepilin-type N-terminal cleavage/methylation domain-containing protein, partial [Vibrio anguillarum]|nr:prepilin-type N-terminal cleavage/methylation domain-containing protein [Vibrio anguillarum]
MAIKTKNSGFTLIELVVVIVILGILSVTAAPRFLNIQSPAKIATLDAFLGAFKAADAMIMGKASFYGIEGAASDVVVPTTDIIINSGHAKLTAENIDNLMTISGYTLFENSTSTLIVAQGRDRQLADVRSRGCYLVISRPFGANQLTGEQF